MKKHIHFIGIGGTAMASLAVAFKRAGFKVTGSEPHEIFAPMCDVLKKHKISYYYSFDEKKVGAPDHVVIGNAHVSDGNVEVNYAKENGLDLIHFPELVKKYVVEKNSLVVSGTYAKTTTTSMLAWILQTAGKNPNYLIGGAPLNFDSGARVGKTNWSVLEGDEYPAASPWDFSPKFAYYDPRYLVLTSADWDHMDIYKTKKSYVDAFKKLVSGIDRNGIIVTKKEGENISEVIKKAKARVVYYSNKKNSGYFIDEVSIKNGKTLFSVFKGKAKVGDFKTSMIGDFNLENWLAAIAMSLELKIPVALIKKAVASFKGIKRRLEIRGAKNGIFVVDDFAHGPAKARSSVKALLNHFKDRDIYIVFEPNRGGRSDKALSKYKNVFDGVKRIYIPKLNEYKKKAGVREVSGSELAAFIKKANKNTVYMADSDKILADIRKRTKKGDVVAFLGSRDFNSLILKLI